MKKLSFILFFFALIINVNAQKKGEDVIDPWREPCERAPYMQGKDGIMLLEITNTAETQEECVVKAKQQAVYALIFKGYTEGNNIPSASAISPSGESLYSEKEEFFKSFFTDATKYASYVTAAKLNTAKPVMKLEKKKVQAAVIVSVEVERLRKDLEAQSIIKGMAAFGFKPKILILPSDDWYVAHPKYIKGKDDQGKNIPDHLEATHDPLISPALSVVSNKFGGPSGAFEVMSIEAALGKNSIQEFKDAQRSDAKKVSYMDALMKTVAADLVVHVDIKETDLERGLKTQLVITLIAIDPYTGSKWFEGKQIEKITTGDNRHQLVSDAMAGAADDFRPMLLEKFKQIVTDGINGEIIVSVLEDADYDFTTKFNAGGREYELSRIVDGATKKAAKQAAPNGAQSPFSRVYSAAIPFQYVDELAGGILSTNTFENYAYMVAAELDKYNLTYKVESLGLGKVELILIGRK